MVLLAVVGLLLGLNGCINAAPVDEGLKAVNISLPVKTAGYDPSFEYHDYSTVQIWMGKDKRTVGTMVGSDLYDRVWKLLDHGCPYNTPHNTCHSLPSGLLTFESRCMVTPPAGATDCTTEIYDVAAKWENESIRKLLIGAVAGALEAVTEQKVTDPTNCYAIGPDKACNVGDVVRVNFPKSNSGIDNYMHIRIFNYYTSYGRWDCCAGDNRRHMDEHIDPMGKEIVDQFPQWWGKDFTRDSRCIINEWEVCR